MKVNLLIQRTFNGLNTEYSSSPTITKLDAKHFLTDERNMAIQLTDAPLFSLAKNEQWICYSFVKKVLDREKRAGFYAIRLFLPVRYTLTNVRECLVTIAKRYESIVQAGNLPHNYNDLLTQIDAKAVKEKPQHTINENSIKKGDFYTIATLDNLEALLAADKNEFLEKLYLFTAPVSSQHTEDFHLQSAEGITTRRLQVSDPERTLQGLWIDESPVLPTAKELLVLTESRVYYQFVKQEKKALDSSITEIQTKRVHISDPNGCLQAFRINNTPLKLKSEFYAYGFSSDSFYYTLKGQKETLLIGNQLKTRKLSVKNPDDYLAHFWVNNIEVPIQKKFDVYGLQSDKLEYSLLGKANERKAITLYEETLVVRLPENRSKSTSTNKLNWENLLLYGVLSLLLGGIGGYLFRNYTLGNEVVQKQTELRVIDSILTAKLKNTIPAATISITTQTVSNTTQTITTTSK
nr:hypothetical protein [uncultured Capnocytophaga sp.]